MKEGIHPKYGPSRIVCTSCDSIVETRATVPEIRVDLCSNCHPFYTGKQRIVDTAGRLHTKFNLMQDLGKKRKVTQAKDTTAPHEVLLVIDADGLLAHREDCGTGH